MKKNDIIKKLETTDSTLLSFPDRNNAWESNSYRGNCSGWIHAFLIWKYQVKKMAELFSGSGTGYDVAKDMEISYVGADLNPVAVRPGILNVNAVTDEVPDSFRDADMIFMHPPYGQEIGIPYAGAEWGAEKVWTKVGGKNKCTVIDHTDELIEKMGYDPKEYDLGRMPWKKFMKTLNSIIMKYYAAMAPGARMGILMGDVRRNGHLNSMLLDMVRPGELEQVIIKAQHNTVSGRSGANYRTNFVPLAHEYLLVLKKVSAYMLDFILPENHELDVRDSQSATWKDVVYAVVNKHDGQVSLSVIYSEIDGHKKCQSNPHWKAKVRQVLNQTGLFVSSQRGYWAVASVA